MKKERYTDGSSGTQLAAIFTAQRLATRFEPFGMRAFAWYDPGLGNLLGSKGGSPLFKLVPAPVLPRQDCQDGEPFTASWQTALGGNTTLDLDPSLWIDGGTLWVPFPATLYIDWPDRDVHN